MWRLCLVLMCVQQSAHAQGLKDSLKQHMREGIEKSEAKAERKKKRATEKKTAPAPPPQPKREPWTPAASLPAPAAPPPAPVPSEEDERPPPLDDKPKGPKLPIRVLGEDLRLDITFGGGYRGWLPQQYDSVEVNVASYATWNIDLKAKLFGWLSLRRGYYESNGASAPRTDEASVASATAKYAPKAVWLLGVLGVPISKAWEPQLRYESRAFTTRAEPNQPVCVVPRDAAEDFDLGLCTRSGADLKIISTFETFVAGVRYDHSRRSSAVVEAKTSKVPPIFFGIGLMQYRKPYQLVVDGYTFSDALFDGRFRGAGLALGAEFGGGLDNYFAELDAQLGLGEVSLTNHLTINELVPKGKTIGYVQGNASLGYRWVLIHAAPTLMLVPLIRLGGASFFLVDTEKDESQEGMSTTSPSVNWDLLWTAQVSLLIPL